MLFPSGIKCIVCDSELNGSLNGEICGECSLTSNTSFCFRCGRAKYNDAEFCLECQTIKQNFDLARAPFIYEDNVKNLVYKLKYGNARYLAPILAKYLADTYKKNNLSADFITFVPLHKRKQRIRGYNQAQLLANELSKLINIPVLDILDKAKDIKNTAKLKRFQRKELIKDSVRVIRDIELKGQTILLIDDVFTTGTTANECAKVLNEKKAAKVNVLTFATSRIFVKLY